MVSAVAIRVSGKREVAKEQRDSRIISTEFNLEHLSWHQSPFPFPSLLQHLFSTKSIISSYIYTFCVRTTKFTCAYARTYQMTRHLKQSFCVLYYMQVYYSKDLLNIYLRDIFIFFQFSYSFILPSNDLIFSYWQLNNTFFFTNIRNHYNSAFHIITSLCKNIHWMCKNKIDKIWTFILFAL